MARWAVNAALLCSHCVVCYSVKPCGKRHDVVPVTDADNFQELVGNGSRFDITFDGRLSAVRR
jgi:hypothetical protein